MKKMLARAINEEIENLLTALRNQNKIVEELRMKIYDSKNGFFLTTQNEKDWKRYIAAFEKQSQIQNELKEKFDERHHQG